MLFRPIAGTLHALRAAALAGLAVGAAACANDGPEPMGVTEAALTPTAPKTCAFFSKTGPTYTGGWGGDACRTTYQYAHASSYEECSGYCDAWLAAHPPVGGNVCQFRSGCVYNLIGQDAVFSTYWPHQNVNVRSCANGACKEGPSPNEVRGFIDHVDTHVHGWACVRYYEGPIDLHLYVDNPAFHVWTTPPAGFKPGTFIGAGTTGVWREPAVAQHCATGYRAHGFVVPIPPGYKGRKLFVHGIIPPTLPPGQNRMIPYGGKVIP